LEKIEPHTLNVPRGDRSNAVLEPWLTDQWYVRIAPLAAPAIKAVADGDIRSCRIIGPRLTINGCTTFKTGALVVSCGGDIGVPAWYDEDGSIYVARTAAEAHQQAAAQHGKAVALKQDDDVLDTWFSSALWPFSTLGWPEQNA